MARNRHDSFRSYQRPSAPFLQPTSSTFGTLDSGSIERSFLATGRRLHTNLLRLVDDLATGSIGVQGFLNRTSSQLRSAYFVAYSLGAISIFPFYTITARDIRILDDVFREETGFLKAFARDVDRGRIGLDPSTRSRLYILALRGIFEQGRLEAMPAGPYRWRLGSTEHCPDCLRASINGPYQRRLADGLGLPVIPGVPGDGSVCQGLTRCGCSVVLESGLPLPNQDLADRLRGLLLEAIHGFGSAAEGAGTD